MKNILNPGIRCTDPDALQFCLPLSGNKFWYCEPNGFNDLLLRESGSTENEIIARYAGFPRKLLKDAQSGETLKAFLNNRLLWLCGTIDAEDFSNEEKRGLLSEYGYRWEDFNSNMERNQIICEIYFETNPMDFRNDI